MSATWATTNKTIMFHPGCVNVQKLVVFVSNHEKIKASLVSQ